MSDFYDIKVVNRSQVEINLNRYKGKYLIVVNTASNCGYAPQFDGLERLYKDYQADGVEVIGFPSNQFRQELKTAKEAAQFCKINYGVSFPIMALTSVKGKDIAPIFEYLTTNKRGLFGTKKIKWNFTKFLVDPNGKVIKRYGPATEPKKIEKDLKKLLNKE